MTDTYPKNANITGHPEKMWRGMLQFRDICNNETLYRKYGALVGRVRQMMVGEDLIQRVRTIEEEGGKKIKGKLTRFIC